MTCGHHMYVICTSYGRQVGYFYIEIYYEGIRTAQKNQIIFRNHETCTRAGDRSRAEYFGS